MTSIWTSEDIEAILRQLDDRGLPFPKYEFCTAGDRLVLLGRGASANVYEVKRRTRRGRKFAVKVIGFGSRHVESAVFRQTVEAQKNVGNGQDNIVKIYDAAEFRVWIEGEHTVVKTEKIEPGKETSPEGNYLHLQFILMEKVCAVIQTRTFGKPQILPQRLASGGEEEILMLAYDIGTALSRAHERKLIHRDVKLENIFWNETEEHYKLGDFGIARLTDHGMASTVAFTKGYGAPEVVGTLEDKYDYTADIYSFGMVLYVLLNRLRFPESENYRPNVHQYVTGYTAPYPIDGSEEFCRIVLKMISFDPDDRYQSMEEALNDLYRLKYGRRVKYRREHLSSALVLGTVFAVLGGVSARLAFAPGTQLPMSGWMYIFCAMCMWKGLLKVRKKDSYGTSLGILAFGIGLLIAKGFTWSRLVLLLYMSFWGDITTALIGGGVVLVNLTGLLAEHFPGMEQEFADFRSGPVLLLSLAAVLLFWYHVLDERIEYITDPYSKRNLYWPTLTLIYALLARIAAGAEHLERNGSNVYFLLLGAEKYDFVFSCDLFFVGIGGMLFCLVWMGRESFMIWMEKIWDEWKASGER
jgi:hypothetical protein